MSTTEQAMKNLPGVGTSLSLSVYVDKDDIRHLYRISGIAGLSPTTNAVRTAPSYQNLVAQPALVQALVEGVIARLLDNQKPSLSTFLLVHSLPVYAADWLTVTVEVRHSQEQSLTVGVTVHRQSAVAATGNAHLVFTG